jgi:hypothetical protein
VDDNLPGTLTVAITAGGGLFALNGQTGLAVTGTGGNLTISGTAADINAALNGAIYHTDVHNNVASNTDDTLTITVTDAVGDTSGPTPIIIDVTCFYPGTLIRTPSGEVAVETLKPGDLVLTHDGREVPVAWLGRQTVSTLFARNRVLPIRIKAGALAENVPARDLLVSPGHGMYVDGALAIAGALVNDTSIVRETDVPTVFTAPQFSFSLSVARRREGVAEVDIAHDPIGKTRQFPRRRDMRRMRAKILQRFGVAEHGPFHQMPVLARIEVRSGAPDQDSRFAPAARGAEPLAGCERPIPLVPRRLGAEGHQDHMRQCVSRGECHGVPFRPILSSVAQPRRVFKPGTLVIAFR